MILAGNVALESMGFKTFGFAGGREDVWESEEDTYWGSEKEWLGDKRYSGDRELENPLAAVQMGLIYVNPEGPNRNPNPLAAARDIRETFARMAMNDVETVALIAGGHAFGKTHGAGDASLVGPAPEAAPIEEQGLGWKSKFNTGKGDDTIGSGLEVIWTKTPTKWNNDFLRNLFDYEWELTKSPAGAHQWKPKGDAGAGTVPDAHDPSKRHAPSMLTTDLALRFDPVYERISRRFIENPDQFADAFARAWFKLTHRDMGPRTRYLRPEVPAEELIWQDPIPAVDHKLIDALDVGSLKGKILASGLSVPELISTAWASASTFRGSDKRGGANGTRIRLAPQKDWEVNQPARASEGPQGLGGHPKRVQRRAGRRQEGITGRPDNSGRLRRGRAGCEGCRSRVGGPLHAGTHGCLAGSNRCGLLRRARADRGRVPQLPRTKISASPEELLVDRAQLLTLTAPEMTVLIGGLRVLNTNFGRSQHGVFTNHAGTLTNDFFVNLLHMGATWNASSEDKGLFEGRDRATGRLKWTGTRVDLIFGSNSQLRALAEVYASEDSTEKFVHDFVAAWNKVMNLDRFDLVT